MSLTISLLASVVVAAAAVAAAEDAAGRGRPYINK